MLLVKKGKRKNIHTVCKQSKKLHFFGLDLEATLQKESRNLTLEQLITVTDCLTNKKTDAELKKKRDKLCILQKIIYNHSQF